MIPMPLDACPPPPNDHVVHVAIRWSTGVGDALQPLEVGAPVAPDAVVHLGLQATTPLFAVIWHAPAGRSFTTPTGFAPTDWRMLQGGAVDTATLRTGPGQRSEPVLLVLTPGAPSASEPVVAQPRIKGTDLLSTDRTVSCWAAPVPTDDLPVVLRLRISHP
jgi:hypothetical protein